MFLFNNLQVIQLTALTNALKHSSY